MKIILKYSVLALIVLISGIMIFLLSLDVNQYKPMLIQTVTDITGRELRITGDLSLTPSLTPVISAQGLSLANTAWSNSGNSLLSVGSVKASVALIPLLTGKINIKQFTLLDTQVSLETDAEGNGNWVMGTDKPVSDDSSGAGQMPESIEIGEVIIRNAHITYLDGVVGTSTQFAINELTTGVSELNAPVAFSLNADYGANPIRLSGTLGPLRTLLADARYSLDISGQISAFNVKAIGNIERPLSIKGLDINLSADTGQLSDLNRYVGQKLPALSPVALSANLKFADLRDIDIEALKIKVGQTDVSGQINFQSAGVRPQVSMQLQSALIDLAPFSQAGEDQPPPELLFSRAALPLEELSRVDLQLTFAANLLKLTRTDLDTVTVDLTVKDGDLQAQLGTGMAGGTVSGELGIDDRTDQAAVLSIDLSGSGIQLAQLPHDLQKPWFSGGPIDLQVMGTGQGSSIAEWMGSYNGKLVIEVGEATLPNSNVDLFGADILMSVFNNLNPFSSSEQSTLLECAVVNLTVKDGIASIDKQIAMQTTRMSMVGSGEINLRTEQLSLEIRPYAREGISLNVGSLTGVAKIGGTLSKQNVEIDAQGVLKAGVSAGAAIATGGLSLLAQGLFSKTTNDPQPCRTALGISAVEQQPSQSTTDKTPEEAEKKGLIDNVKGGFNKLFGR